MMDRAVGIIFSRAVRGLWASAILFALYIPLKAQAATLPGEECTVSGEFRWSGGTDVAAGGHLLVCTGSSWQSLISFNRDGEVTRLGNQTCTTGQTYKFNGGNWACYNDLSVHTGECNGPGQPCQDGTIFAGTSPDGGVPMYTTPADGGGFFWTSATATINTAVVDCVYTNPVQTGCTTGRANTNILAAIDTPVTMPAARYCANLVAHGRDDWYLPAVNELTVLYNNRVAIGNFASVPYWSSSEEVPGATTRALTHRFATASLDSEPAYIAYPVRCVRR